MIRFSSISFQVTIILMVIAFSMLFAGYFVNISSLKDSLTSKDVQRLINAENLIKRSLENMEKASLTTTHLLSRDADFNNLLEAWLSGKPARIKLESFLSEALETSEVSMAMLIDSDLKVAGCASEGHKVAQGDDVSGIWGAYEAVKGKEVLSVSRHFDKWYLIGFEPLFDDDQSVGAFMTAIPIDDTLAMHLFLSTGVDVTIGKHDLIVASSYAGRSHFLKSDLIRETLKEDSERVFDSSASGTHIYMYSNLIIVDENFSLVLDTDTTASASIISAKRKRLLGYSIFAFVVIFSVVQAFTFWFTKPIKELARRAERIKGKYSDLEADPQFMGSEVQVLKRSFESMVSALDEKISLLEKMNIDLSFTSEMLEKLSAHMISVGEEEKRDVSRRIHDQLGQMLTGMRMDTKFIESELSGHADKSVAMERLKELTGNVDQMISTVQQITSELRPPVLDDLGLVPAVEWLCENFLSKAYIEYDITVWPGDLDVGKNLALPLYRVCQEALTNVVRHSGADRVEISLVKEAGELSLEVSDNGIGISVDTSIAPPSFGLMGMKEVLKPLKGKLEISSGSDGTGTRLRATILVE